MKKYTYLLFLSLFITPAIAQVVDVLSYSGSGKSSVLTIKTKTNNSKNDLYYYDNWRVGKIHLISGDIIKDYPIRYNLKKNIIEIKAGSQIKLLTPSRIKQIVWVNDIGQQEILINAMIFDAIIKPEIGLLSILVVGKLGLLKRKYTEVINSNYILALDIGNEESKEVKRTKYLILKGNAVTPIKTGKKQILKLFGEKAKTVKAFSSNNNLSYKKEQDLIKIFNFYNSL